MAIAYDSTAALAIVTAGDEHFELQSWSLRAFHNIFKKEYKGTYIKMNLVEQNIAGNIFAVAYQDNGRFYVSVVDNKGGELDNLDVTEHLGLDTLSKPITGFWEPMITCCFIENDDLFIQVYHRLHKKQYHFTYSYTKHDNLSNTIITANRDPSCTQKNFPVKSFYSTVTKNVLTFYRQGFCQTVNPAYPAETRIEKITDKDLGNMYLLFD
jgi:hypothetical protein|tara:strand:+ start:574 stop:1206 length:633 start_codon:yes stop_codon:yes gene_type:complete